MKENYTYIGAVLDRSGSMGSGNKIDEARGSFNNFLKEQRELEGEADIYLTVFDDRIETIYNGDLNKCFELNEVNFYPRGMTSLYDAIGLTVKNIGETLSKKEESEKPGKVIILIITDGQENNSTEFSSEQLKEIIEEQKNKYSWEFIFMGTTEESIRDAKSFGITRTFGYDDSSVGTVAAYSALSTATSMYRSGSNLDDFDYEKIKGGLNEN